MIAKRNQICRGEKSTTALKDKADGRLPYEKPQIQSEPLFESVAAATVNDPILEPLVCDVAPS